MDPLLLQTTYFYGYSLGYLEEFFEGYTFMQGGDHSATFTRPKLFCGYRSHLLIDFDEKLYGSFH